MRKGCHFVYNLDIAAYLTPQCMLLGQCIYTFVHGRGAWCSGLRMLYVLGFELYGFKLQWLLKS